MNARPYTGARVLFELSDADAAEINLRRKDAEAYRRKTRRSLFEEKSPTEPGDPGRTGHIAHRGNAAEQGQVFPALVVRDWDEPAGTVNLQVFLDGNDTYWATSRTPGDGPGTWRWPRSAG
jgi:hypothetical protein